MDDLIQLLRDIEADDTIQAQKYLTDGEPSPKVDEASGLACEELITSNGGCNRTNMRLLDQAGFHVFPGEQDSFGWLTGCIRTKKGIVVYG